MSKAIQQFSGLLNRIAESTWVAYLALVLLQLKVMLFIWKYRDLASGDTSSYYWEVFSWLDGSKVDIVWSPVYTLFLAALHRLINDPFWVLIVAQITIAVTASVLSLALFRRLLPKHIAWFLAAWWAVLPINFDTVYSVHLFSALFPLALFVIAACANNVYGRGIVLGGLLLTAVLVRNEYGALFILWAVALVGWELYLSRWKGRSSPSAGRYLFAYGVPLAGALLIIGLFVANSTNNYFEIKKELQSKHTLNVCQIYAYNRKQQGDSWRGNPWTECQSIVERDFGRSSVTFSQAFFLNPRAILGHIWWNIGLIPSGTQLALFDFYAGGPNPDYIRARQSPMVLIPFLLVLVLGAFGASRYFIVPIIKRRKSIENQFAWLLMLSAALLVVGLMMMQRPRPSYMFPYTIFLMALAGLGLYQILEYIRMNNTLKACWPIAGALLILLVPSHYDSDYVNHFGYKGQPYRNSYERVLPYLNRTTLTQPPVLVTPTGDETLCNYLGISGCAEIRYGEVAGPDFESQAKGRGVNWIYLDTAFGPLAFQYNMQNWQLVSQGRSLSESWVLLRRQGFQ